MIRWGPPYKEILKKFDANRGVGYHNTAGWSSLVARWAHNPKVGGSNPPPATNSFGSFKPSHLPPLFFIQVAFPTPAWSYQSCSLQNTVAATVSASLRAGSLQGVRAAAEREYILKKLDETKGNVTRAAELLGLERSNLYRKMKALGIAPKE